MKRIVLGILVLAAQGALAQTYGRLDFHLQNAQGQAVSGATVNVYTQPTAVTTATISTVQVVAVTTSSFPSQTFYYTLVTFTANVPAIVPGQTYAFSGLTGYTALNGKTLGSLTSSTTFTLTPVVPGNNQALFLFGSATYATTNDTGSAQVVNTSSCGSAANISVVGQAALYSTANGVSISQPVVTNGFGEAFAYAAQGCYTVVYNSPYTGTLTYKDQNAIPAASIVAAGGGGSTGAKGAQLAVQFNNAGSLAGSAATVDSDGNLATPGTITDGAFTGPYLTIAPVGTPTNWTLDTTTPTTAIQSMLPGVSPNGASGANMQTLTLTGTGCGAGTYAKGDGSGCGPGGTGVPGGSSAQIQYNNSGAFAGSAATINTAGDIATPAKLSVGTTILHKDGVSPANLIAMGADPTGVADSTTAINSWLSYAASHGVEAYCPPGIYLTSGSTLTASHNNLHIRGPHWAYPNAQPGCHFKLTSAGGSIFASTVTISSVEIENVWLDLNGVSGTAHAMNTVLNRWWKFHDNLVSGAVAGAGSTYWKSGGDLYTWAYKNVFLGAAMYSLDWQGIYASVGNRGCNECWVYHNIDQIAGGVRFGGDIHYTYNDKESSLTQLNPALSYAALIDCTDGATPLACDVTGNYIEMAVNGAFPLSSLSNDGTTTTIVTPTPPTTLSVGSLVSIANTHTAADGLNLTVASKSGSTITVAQTIGGGIVSIPSYTVSALSCVTGTCTVTTSATNPAVAGDAFYISGTGTCADFVFDRWAINILSSTQFTFQVTGCTASSSAGTIIFGQVMGPYAGGLIGVNVDSKNYSASITNNRLWAGGQNKGDPNVAVKIAAGVDGWTTTGNLYEFWTTDKAPSLAAIGTGSYLNIGESRGPGGTQGDGSTDLWEPGTTNTGNNVSSFGGMTGFSCSGLGCIVSNHRLNFTASTYTGTTLDLATGNVFRWTAAATISTVLNAKPGQIFSIEATATPVVLPTATFNNASGADATLVVNRPVWYQVGYAGNIREIGIGSTLANQSAGALWYSDASKPVAIQGTGFAKFNTSGAPTFFLPSGTGAKLASTTGTLTSTHCVSINAAGDLIDAGAACAGGTSFTVHLTGQTAAIGSTAITTVGGARQCYVANELLHTTAVGTAGTINTAILATLDGSALTVGTSGSINATQVPANGGSLALNQRYFCADAGTNVNYNVGFTGVTGSYTYNLDITLQAVN